MRRIPRRTVDSVVGFAVFVFGAIFLVIAFQSGGAQSDGGYPLTATFRQVDGITIGSSVHLAGIKVGEVSSLRFEPKTNRAIVELRIRNTIKLPEDTSAQVVTDGLLGAKFIKLVPGGQEETLPPGAALIYVQDGVIVEQLLEKLILNAEQQRNERLERLKDCKCGK